MALRDDVDAGLAGVGTTDGKTPYTLDDRGTCVVTVPVPKQVATLADDKLLVQVQMGRTGRMFSLRSPLAKLRESPDASLGETLLRRQYYPEQVGGLGFALSAEDDALVATYHWLLDSISPEQFSSLFSRFATGMFDLAAEIADMAHKDASLQPVHPKAGR